MSPREREKPTEVGDARKSSILEQEPKLQGFAAIEGIPLSGEGCGDTQTRGYFNRTKFESHALRLLDPGVHYLPEREAITPLSKKVRAVSRNDHHFAHCSESEAVPSTAIFVSANESPRVTEPRCSTNRY